jgi:hypothetical protein
MLVKSTARAAIAAWTVPDMAIGTAALRLIVAAV